LNQAQPRFHGKRLQTADITITMTGLTNAKQLAVDDFLFT
jgi:hypothetical protein